MFMRAGNSLRGALQEGLQPIGPTLAVTALHSGEGRKGLGAWLLMCGWRTVGIGRFPTEDAFGRQDGAVRGSLPRIGHRDCFGCIGLLRGSSQSQGQTTLLRSRTSIYFWDTTDISGHVLHMMCTRGMSHRTCLTDGPDVGVSLDLGATRNDFGYSLSHAGSQQRPLVLPCRRVRALRVPVLDI